MFSLRRVVIGLHKSPIQFFSSSTHHHHNGPKTPVYAPKVTEKLIWINIYNEGNYERIPAYIGETLQQALSRFNVENHYPECDGGQELFSMTEKLIDPNTFGPFCGGCRVNVHEPWLSKLNPIHYLEEKTIDSSMFPSNAQTRLSCCIVLEKWMDDLIITVPRNDDGI